MEVLSYNSYAGFGRRFLAFLIDRVCIWLLLYILFGNHMHVSMYHIRHIFNPNTLWIEMLMMAYFVACETSSWQGTLGKKALGLKVVTEKYGRLKVGDAVLRFLAKYLSAMILFLGFIWIAFDRQKQGWHDKIAGTYVIVG